MKTRIIIKEIEAVGYEYDRTGEHHIYEKEGCPAVQVPKGREVNDTTAKKILKTAGVIK